MSRPSIATLVAVALPLLVGCVPAAKYQKVVEENSRLETRIDHLQAKAQARLKALKELLEDLKPLIDRGLLSVEFVDGRVVLGMTADVLFPSGSAELSPDGKKTIGELTQALRRRTSDQNFQIEGHTDNEPIHTAEFPDNWHLGAARSITVLEFMVEQGFPKNRLSAATFGDTQPVASNMGVGKAQNRRIEIVLLPDLNDLPGSKQLLDALGKPSRPRGTGGQR